MYIYLGITLVLLSISLLFEFSNKKVEENYRGSKINLLNGKVKKSGIIFFCSCAALLFLSCFRKGIGTDYNVYSQRFLYNIDELSNSFIIFHFAKFIRNIRFPFQILIIVASLLFLIPVFKSIYRSNSKFKLFGLAYFVGVGYYQLSYNIFRQCAAIGLLCTLLWEYNQKKYINCIILIMLIVGIHNIVAPFILIFWLIIKWNPKKLIIGILNSISVLIFLFLNNDITVDIILYFIDKLRYISSLSAYAITSNEEYWNEIYAQSPTLEMKLLFIPMIIILSIMLLDNEYCKNKLTSYELGLIKISYFYILITSIKMGSTLVTRFLMCISIILVLTIPLIIQYCFDRLTKYRKWGSLFKVGLTGLLFVFIIYMSVVNIKYNGGEVYPYTSIFSYR